MSNLVIRRGSLADAALLAELGARTFSETFAADNSPENMAAYLVTAFSPAQQAAELADPAAAFFIAENSGPTKVLLSPNPDVAAGYAMIRCSDTPASVSGANPIELVRLYVSRENIGCGVGASLMQACIHEAKRRGHETLWLGVWEQNARAQAFYRKWNFVPVGTHVFQLGNDPQTDILLERSLA